MDENIKSLYLARLVSGQQRIRHEKQTFLLKNPKESQVLVLEEFLYLFRAELIENEILNRSELTRILIKNGLWSIEEEKKLESVKKQIEELKISLFQARFKSNEQKIIRKNIIHFNKELDDLSNKKMSYDQLSIDGILFATRLRVLFGMCIYNRGGELYWQDQFDFEDWDNYDPVLDGLFFQYVQNKIHSEQIREIARTDPWTNYWSMREVTSKAIFDDSVICLSDEQRALISWSTTYDFIHNLQGADKLSEDIIKDDDMLDGWLILYNRQNNKGGQGLLGNQDKFGNADEVFIPVDTIEDAKKIYEMNSAQAKNTIRKKMDLIDKRGEVSEVEMPDFQEKYQQAYQQACLQANRRR